MAFKKITYPKGTSPKGVAVFPYLNKPDGKFNPDKPVYKTTLRVAEEQAQDLIARVDGLMTAMENCDPKVLALLSDDEVARLKKAANGKDSKGNPRPTHRPADLPYGQATDRDGGDIDGQIDFKFKKNGQFTKKTGEVVKAALPLFDAKGKPISVEVWGGSEIKVSFSLRPWVNAKSEYGVKLGMEAVQVIALRSAGASQDAAGYGFGEEDGFVSEDDTGTQSGEAETSEGASDDGEDF